MRCTECGHGNRKGAGFCDSCGAELAASDASTAVDTATDIDVLRTLARHNRIEVGEAGQYPCAGAYAVVEAPGMMRTGDRVALT